MPRRDALILLGYLALIGLWFRAEYRRAAEHPALDVAAAWIASDSALAAALGGTPSAGRLVTVDGTRESPDLWLELAPPHRGTDVEVRLYAADGAWRVSELAVYAPDTTFLVPYRDPALPDGPIVASAVRAESADDSLRTLLRRGYAFQRENDFAAALDVFRDARRIAPDDYDATFWYASELARAGRVHEAGPLLDSLIVRAPERGEAYFTRAVMRRRLGQDEPVAEDLRASCRLGYELACTTLDRNGRPR